MEEVLIDRSIFHGEKFDQLRKSRLAQCVSANKVRVYFTPAFVEETLHFGFGREADLKPQIDFLFSLNSTHWYRPAESIVSAELGLNYVHGLYHLLTDEEIAHIKVGTGDYLNDRLTESEKKQLREDVDKNNRIREEFRQERLRLRREVILNGEDYRTYFEKEAEYYIENGAMNYHPDSTNYLRRWRAYRKDCPFTEQYLKCRISAVYLPITNGALAVGRNDLADATQLAYLAWADTMVSDDTRYMKEAFNLIYGGTKKKYLSLPEFIAYMDRL